MAWMDLGMNWKDLGTSWKEPRLIDTSIDIVVYQGVTHGEHEGKLSALLVTKYSEVYGRGVNTLVTNSDFNREYPMLEAGPAFLPSWVKVEKLSEVGVKKIVVGFGWGAALTKHDHLVVWGYGAPSYLSAEGVDIVELYDSKGCTTCTEPCADYGRRIGNTLFSYCKQRQCLVTYSEHSIPSEVKVKRLGNRRFGALICSQCSKECDLEVMENHSFNFCNNCNHLWDLDENAKPMNVATKPIGSFLRRLDYLGKIRDVAPAQFGFWVLLEPNRLTYSGFFVQPDPSYRQPVWWKVPLIVPKAGHLQRAESIHANTIDVFVVTDARVMYRRVKGDNPKSTGETYYKLIRVPMDGGVKKMVCGRIASLCYLDNGTVMLINSYSNSERSDSDVVYKEKNEDLCLDITGIWCADVFYVKIHRYKASFRKKHPEKGSVIEVIYGAMDCKAFLWHFSKTCMVWSDGKMWYDEEAIAQLIKKEIAQPENVRDGSPEKLVEEPPVRPEPVSPGREMEPAPVCAGVGFPVGATLWSTWGLGSIHVAAIVGKRLAGGVKHAYDAVAHRIGRGTQQLGAAMSSTWNVSLPPVTIPPFQSGLYGKAPFSDIVIILADGKLPAHRVILCSTSKFFREKLSGTKFDTKCFDVKNQNPRAYRCLLKHFYQHEPDDLSWRDTLDLLVLSTKYDERRIAGEVEDKMQAKFNADNVADILEVAKKHKLGSLIKKCNYFMRTDPTYMSRYDAASSSRLFQIDGVELRSKASESNIN